MRVVVFGDTTGVPPLLARLGPDRLVGLVASGIRPQYHAELGRIAAQARVPLLIQPGPRDPDFERFVGRLSELAPDLIFVHCYAMKLPASVLERAATAINIHGALLPRYRGASPVQSSIIAGEQQIGVTAHYMTDRIDAGDIIAQRPVAIRFEDTWRDVLSRILFETEALLDEVVPAALEGRCRATPQREEDAVVCRRRTREDGRIDWSSSAIDIYNLIRALVSPLPGAFYDTPTGPISLPEYLKVSEVIELKYGSAGGQHLCVETMSLRPAMSADPSNHRFGFDLVRSGADAGPLDVVVDWHSRSGVATLSPAFDGQDGSLDAVLGLLASQLKLERLDWHR